LRKARELNRQESAGAFAAAFVAPGIHDEEKKNDEPQKQQYDRAGFVLPQSAEAAGELVKIHGQGMYTKAAQSQLETVRTD
jgi:hypothetical protein